MVLPVVVEEPLWLGAFCAALFFFFCFLGCYGFYRKERLRREFLELQLEQQKREVFELRRHNDVLATGHRELQAENRDLAVEKARLQAAYVSRQEQYESEQSHFEETRRQLEQEFQILADRIFSEKGKRLTSEHREGLQQLLTPMREQLLDFKTRVEDIYDRQTRDQVAMTGELKHLQKLNQRLSKDATNLASALKGENKLQGNWGEMVLEKLLEESGLQSGREFSVQPSMAGREARRLQPDIVVHLPGKRDIIIDAKFSLVAYERALHCVDPEDEQKYLHRHQLSVKKHIRSLASKRYHELDDLNSIDFVLLFMPVEGAFQAAVSKDPELLSHALRQQVMLCSPSSLFAILRTIEHLWRVDEQNRNALTIAKQAGNLYDKFVGFVEAFEDIGSRLEQGTLAWKRARKRLVSGQGNLVRRAQVLRELGVQPEKSFPKKLSLDAHHREEDS